MRGCRLGDLTWVEAKSVLDAGHPVLVPVGAAAKAHGAHLPLDTDRVLAGRLSRAVAERLAVVVAPIVDVGWYPAFTGYSGSQSLSASTFISVVTEILVKLASDGATRLAVLNTGVSTEAPLGIAIRSVLERTGVKVRRADIRALGRGADGVLEQACAGGHADEHETSLMLYLDAARVKMDQAVSESHAQEATSVFTRPVTLGRGTDPGDRSHRGATGDPTLATAAKGRIIFEAMVADLVEGLQLEFPGMRESL